MLVGNAPEPGMALPASAYRTILMPETFPVYAKLTHFVAFFATVNPVHLQIWRQNYTDYTFTLLYSQRAMPDVTFTAQTVSQCSFVLKC